MAEYIDRDALLAEAKRISGPMTGDGWDNWGVYALINRQPAADVVEVVRCKDCIHYDGRLCHNPNTFDDEKTAGNTTDMWYCADGEKKNG